MIQAALLLALVPASLAQDFSYRRKAQPAAQTASEIPPAAGGVLNFSCVNALAAIGHADLAGVFSFISEKDSAAAFGDFVARNRAAMKSYVAKLDRDLKVASGITSWDHEVVVKVLELYASPLAETLEKLPAAAAKKLNSLSMAPTLTLEELTARKAALR